MRAPEEADAPRAGLAGRLPGMRVLVNGLGITGPPVARETMPTVRRSNVEPCHSRAALGAPIRDDRPPARTIPAVFDMLRSYVPSRCAHWWQVPSWITA